MSFHTKLCCVPSSSILLSLIKSLWSISVPSIVFLGTLPKTVYRNVCAQRCSNLFAFVYLKSGIQSLNSHFQHEFPSLQAAGDQEKTAKEQPDEAQGSAPSLRPQCMCSIYCFFFFYLTALPFLDSLAASEDHQLPYTSWSRKAYCFDPSVLPLLMRNSERVPLRFFLY